MTNQPSGTKCNDNNPCTTEKCDTLTGACVYSNVTCTAPTDKCKLSACSMSGPTAGTCVQSDLNCIPANPSSCYNYGCDSASGCYTTAKTCNDNDPCTIDTCNPNTANGCVYTPMDCNDNNPCTTDSCSNGQCVNQPITCNNVSLTFIDFLITYISYFFYR